jgi:hypothetical protein
MSSIYATGEITGTNLISNNQATESIQVPILSQVQSSIASAKSTLPSGSAFAVSTGTLTGSDYVYWTSFNYNYTVTSPPGGEWTILTTAFPGEIQYLHVANDNSGNIYCMGGWNTLEGSTISSCYVYNINTNTITSIASLPIPLFGVSCYSGGTVYMIGMATGSFASGGQTFNGTVYAYNVSSNSWSEVGSTGIQIVNADIYNGSWYVVGYSSWLQQSRLMVWQYNPPSGFNYISTIPVTLSGEAQAFSIYGGIGYVLGQSSSTNAVNYGCNLSNGSWSQYSFNIDSNFLSDNTMQTATVGSNIYGVVSNSDAIFFDPASNNSGYINEPPVGQIGPACCTSYNNVMYTLSGWNTDVLKYQPGGVTTTETSTYSIYFYTPNVIT